MDCPICHTFLGEVTKKTKYIGCIKCKIVVPVTYSCIGYSHKRNYPQGYWENQ